MREIKNAFAVEKPGLATPTEPQRVIIERVCGEIVRRRLTTPALMMLEMSRPLNFVGAQAMHFFTPLVSTVTDAKGYEQFAMFLEKRGSIAYMCARIEALQRPAPPDSPTPDDGDSAKRQATEDDHSGEEAQGQATRDDSGEARDT